MTINRSLGPFFLGAICTLVLTIVPEFAGAQDCHVRIYSYNDDYLEATVDTRALGSNLVLENVSFEVNLRIKEKDQKVAFDFTNADHRSLGAGQVYQRYIAPFSSGIPIQVVVGAGSCAYTKVLSWAKSDSLIGGANNRERNLLRSNHPPAPGRVVGKVPPRCSH